MATPAAAGTALPTGFLPGFGIPPHDYIGLTYEGDVLVTVTYRSGGATGTVVGTLTLGYDGTGKLVSVTASV